MSRLARPGNFYRAIGPRKKGMAMTVRFRVFQRGFAAGVSKDL